MVEFFDPLLSLEEDFYNQGYALGLADGEQAGRLEGRLFGLEKGFEKFLELGHLQGRCSVWKARVPDTTKSPLAVTESASKEVAITNVRAQKNIESMALLLTNPPFTNDEESVEEVEETLKRGRAKAKVLERMLGEKDRTAGAVSATEAGESSIEDASHARGARGGGRS